MDTTHKIRLNLWHCFLLVFLLLSLFILHLDVGTHAAISSSLELQRLLVSGRSNIGLTTISPLYACVLVLSPAVCVKLRGVGWGGTWASSRSVRRPSLSQLTLWHALLLEAEEVYAHFIVDLFLFIFKTKMQKSHARAHTHTHTHTHTVSIYTVCIHIYIIWF